MELRISVGGRPVSIEHLEMTNIYSGILEGVPNRAWNERLLARLVERARALLNHPPVIVQPPVHRYAPRPGSSYVGEEFPAIGCIGRFSSSSPARDREADGSDLAVVWFQANIVFPPPVELISQLAEVDWDAGARDSYC
jgi:hypothetical protein